MGYKNREIEVKLLVNDKPTYRTVCNNVEEFLRQEYPDRTTITGRSSDTYWRAPHRSVAAFVRLRQNPHGKAQITLKSNDKGDNVDRVEIDLEVDDFAQAKELLAVLHGEELEKVTKRYNVYFLENSDTNIAVYQIVDDPQERVFVEIEGRSIKRVNSLVKGFTEWTGWNFLVVNSSIYEMFVVNKEMKTSPVAKFLEIWSDK